jgi:uncharacterized protein (TIGR03086 family)
MMLAEADLREANVNVPELHQRACALFGERVHQVGDDQWNMPTPCSDWDVRTLVNHVTAENLWTPPLMKGSTVEEVGNRFDGDVLGSDPKGAWDGAARAALSAVQEEGAMERTVHLSFGDSPGREYAYQLFADHLIHSWDLARGVGADDSLDPELVDACAAWFAQVEDAYRAGGAIGPRPEIPEGADAQTRLLAMFGRTA